MDALLWEEPWLWTHFCFRGLWEDEMFARQHLSILPEAYIPPEHLILLPYPES